MSTKPSVLVLLPAYGYFNSSSTTMSLFSLAAMLTATGLNSGMYTMSHSDVVASRNVLLTFWYDHMLDFTHTLWVDADMNFQPEAVMDMLVFNKPLCGAFYLKKMEQAEWVGELWKYPDGSLPPVVHKHFMPAQYLGFGLTLVSRSCVDAIVAKYPQDIRQLDPDDDFHKSEFQGHKFTRILEFFNKIGRLSEDYSFCHRYASAGGEVWANVGHTIGHVGTKGWSGRYLDALEKTP